MFVSYMVFFVIRQDADWSAHIGCQFVSPTMNIIVAYLEVQSSHKRRKIAKYGCHKLWGLSVVKQLKVKDNKIFLTLFVFSLKYFTTDRPYTIFCNFSSFVTLLYIQVCYYYVHGWRNELTSYISTSIRILTDHEESHVS